MNKRAAIYARTSTLDQHTQNQVYDLQQLARQRGPEVVKVYENQIWGTRARRPGLDQLMTDAWQGKFDVLLVWTADLLARSVSHFLRVLDELDHLGVEFASYREILDTAGPSRSPVALRCILGEGLASTWLAGVATFAVIRVEITSIRFHPPWFLLVPHCRHLS